MNLQTISLILIIILGRYAIPSIDLFLIAFYTIFILDHNRRTRTINEFIVLTFVYSFLRESIIGLFPFVFIITSVLLYAIVNKVPKSGTVLSFISIILISITTVSYATLNHLLQNNALYFFPESLKMGLATALITILLVIFINTRKKRI